MNTLQNAYLTDRWRHNCVTFNVTEIYFVELKINIGRLHCVQEKKHPLLFWL